MFIYCKGYRLLVAVLDPRLGTIHPSLAADRTVPHTLNESHLVGSDGYGIPTHSLHDECLVERMLVHELEDALSVGKITFHRANSIQDQTWFVNTFFQKIRCLKTNHLRSYGHKMKTCFLGRFRWFLSVPLGAPLWLSLVELVTFDSASIGV